MVQIIVRPLAAIVLRVRRIFRAMYESSPDVGSSRNNKCGFVSTCFIAQPCSILPVLTSVLPVRTSTEIWLGPKGHVGLNSLENNPSVCNFCNLLLKPFTETAKTDNSSKEFQRLIARSVKKC